MGNLASETRGGGSRRSRTRRALIVDDDAGGRKLLRLQLEGFGFEVAAARHGVEALAMARERPPDVILSDVQMPEMDGFRLCLEVRRDARLRGVPVILYSSGYVNRAERELAERAGANALLCWSGSSQALLDAAVAALTEDPVPAASEAPAPPEAE